MTAKQRVRRLAAWSIAVAFGVMGLKFVSWWVTGSVALFSDALESIVNVIAALVAWVAIRVSHTPADDDHPFGVQPLPRRQRMGKKRRAAQPVQHFRQV